MVQEKEMSFLDHLEELRWHIIRCTIAIIAAATFAFLGKSFLFDKLIFGPTKADFFTYDLLCKASALIGYDSFCNTSFDFEVQSRTMAGQFSAHICAENCPAIVLLCTSKSKEVLQKLS